MPLMSTFGFGPGMIDFRTVMAAAFALGFALVLLLAAEIWARGSGASKAKALLPLMESPRVAEDAMTHDVAVASNRESPVKGSSKVTTRSPNEPSSAEH
jgi:hypothetical protein